MKEQDKPHQKFPSVDAKSESFRPPLVQTESGKILQLLKMPKEHPQFSQSRIPLMFRVQTPGIEQPYILTYDQLRQKDQFLLLDYFQSRLRIHGPQPESILTFPYNFSEKVDNAEIQFQNQIQREISQQPKLQKMENKRNMNQFEDQFQYFIDLSQISRELPEHQNEIPLAIQSDQSSESSEEPICFGFPHLRQLGELRPASILVGNSGCYDVQFDDPKYYAPNKKLIHDFDNDLEKVGIAPYSSHVYFEPITVPITVKVLENTKEEKIHQGGSKIAHQQLKKPRMNKSGQVKGQQGRRIIHKKKL